MHRFTLAALAGLAFSAQAQVVINEVWENPPGSGSVFDVALEYIELYGEPGTDLTGWAIALIKGGTDPDGNNIPNILPEIDEAFQLDGLTIGPSGFLVIYNNTGGFSDIPGLLPPGTPGVGYTQRHIPTTDTAGNLANDDSSTYLLVRRRPFHSIVNGVSVYAPGYAFRKDVNPDVNFDGKLDFGIETPVGASPSALRVDPLQIIDEVAWSNGGGKEYVRSSQQEISETPGFNPDAVSRVEYYNENPLRGLRINSQGDVVPTRMADEEWIYGDNGPGDGSFFYDPTRSGAPTDPNGDGFQDIDITGFMMTPGTFNDTGPVTQFRFVRGDFNFDKVVDAADGALIAAKVGEHLDITTGCVDEQGNPVMVGGVQAQCSVYEGRAANTLLAMMNMDKTDGPGGANAPTVTQADLDAWNAEFGAAGCSIADLAEPFGILDLADINAFVSGFVTNSPIADLAEPFGILDLADINAFISGFVGGCP